ncbi:MAG: alpha/beta hydrolase fold domain-containing protein [Acholeplasmatales bacterium]|nr:alpha/beta hydrolase fold domain-containing protein [Acholeplasmatales bacterium]
MKKYILDTINYYTEYFIDNEKRPTIVVSPGGGYQYTSPRESLPVAKAYNSYGYHVVVVNYRETVDEAYPKTAEYLAYVFKLLKNDERVSHLIGLGFSAGGHNLLEVTLHNENYKMDKPDLIMLGYPVVTSEPKYAHMGSFKNLLKEKENNLIMRKYLSMEYQVKKGNPDLFLWGTFTDESVDVMNSLLLLEAYRKAKCNAEYHVFPMGGHGLSVANSESAEGNLEKINPYIARWVELSIEWLKNKLK